MAKLIFKYGAMNSGKSDSLIKTAFNYEERGLKVVVIKSSLDTKGGKKIVARGGHKRDIDILAKSDTNLQSTVLDYQKDYGSLNCILVDEAQFLTPTQVNQLFRLTKINNISTIAHGLRTDFRNELFPGSQQLLALADKIEKLPTMCHCGAQAEFNARKINGDYVFVGEQIAIDNETKISYESLCGKCYLEVGGII